MFNNIKNILLKFLPLISSFLFGMVFIFSSSINTNFFIKYNFILIQIGLSMVSIPFVFLFYESVKSYRDRFFNKKILELLHSNIDPHLLSLDQNLTDIVIVYGKINKINRFETITNLTKQQIREYLSDGEPRTLFYSDIEEIQKTVSSEVKNALEQRIFNDEEIRNLVDLKISLDSFFRFSKWKEIFYNPKSEKCETYWNILKYNRQEIEDGNKKINNCFINNQLIDEITYHIHDLSSKINNFTKGKIIISPR